LNRIKINEEVGTFSIWKSAKLLDVKSNGSTTCMISVKEEHIYLIGGVCNNFEEVDEVWRYEISTNSWMAMPSLNRARYFANACCHDGTLYVFGGRIGQK